jgi:hypothetical protein
MRVVTLCCHRIVQCMLNVSACVVPNAMLFPGSFLFCTNGFKWTVRDVSQAARTAPLVLVSRCEGGHGARVRATKTDYEMPVLLPTGAWLRPAKAAAFKHRRRKEFPQRQQSPRPGDRAICPSPRTETSRRRRLNPHPLAVATTGFPRLGPTAFKIFQAVCRELSMRVPWQPQRHPLLWLMCTSLRAHVRLGSSCSHPPVSQPLPSRRTWSSIPNKRKSQSLQSSASVAGQHRKSTLTIRSRWRLIIIVMREHSF